jgi:hypothetical protein
MTDTDWWCHNMGTRPSHVSDRAFLGFNPIAHATQIERELHRFVLTNKTLAASPVLITKRVEPENADRTAAGAAEWRRLVGKPVVICGLVASEHDGIHAIDGFSVQHAQTGFLDTTEWWEQGGEGVAAARGAAQSKVKSVPTRRARG